MKHLALMSMLLATVGLVRDASAGPPWIGELPLPSSICAYSVLDHVIFIDAVSVYDEADEPIDELEIYFPAEPFAARVTVHAVDIDFQRVYYRAFDGNDTRIDVSDYVSLKFGTDKIELLVSDPGVDDARIELNILADDENDYNPKPKPGPIIIRGYTDCPPPPPS